MTQSSVFLVFFALFFLIITGPWRKVIVVCSPYFSMPFVYPGFKLGIPLLISFYFFWKLLANPIFDRREILLILTLSFCGLIGFLANSPEVSWGEYLVKSVTLFGGFLFFWGISKRTFWREVTQSRIENVIIVLALFALAQLAFINSLQVWGSVDGNGQAFFANQDILGVELPRVNLLGYEPKHLGMFCCFLQGMYYIRCSENKSIPRWSLTLALLAVVILTGSKSAFVAFVLILILSFSMFLRRGIAVALFCIVLVFVLTVFLKYDFSELRIFSFVDIIFVDDITQLQFGGDKDLPAIITLVKEPHLLILGVGYGLSPFAFVRNVDINIDVITTPNFGVIALLYNFGLIGCLAILIFVLFTSKLRKMAALVLLVPSLMLFDLYVFFMALGAILSSGACGKYSRAQSEW